MKLETIKKDKRKKIIIGSMIFLSVVAGITLTTTRAKYRSVQSLKLASGTIKLNQYDFKIMAMYQSEDGENYTDITTMPESGYVINEEKSYCTADNKTQVKGKLKTIDGNHVMVGLNKNDKCYIWFDKYEEPQTIDTIIAAIEASSSFKSGTPDFTQVATGAETEANNGIYKVSDGMYGGYSYYWRGIGSTNHVKFANFCWRLVRINGDKSIRLIYNGIHSGNTCPGSGDLSSVIIGETDTEKYYATNDGQSNKSYYVGWTYTLNEQRTTSGTESNAKIQTEKWYKNNIMDKGFDKKVSTGKFCNDRDVVTSLPEGFSSGWDNYWSISGAKFLYSAYKRILHDYSPSLSCSSGDVYNLKVGAITADEVMFAGGNGGDNTLFYLFANHYYWTMTPRMMNNNNSADVFVYGEDLTASNVGWNGVGLRPVINLNPDTLLLGKGTASNPYIVQ